MGVVEGGGEGVGDGSESHQEIDLMRTVTMVTASARLLHVVRRSGGRDSFEVVLPI